MKKYTVALNADFCMEICIYHVDSENEFEAKKKAIIQFITEKMNPNYQYKHLILQQVTACKNIESLGIFIYNNVINISIQETPVNIETMPLWKFIQREDLIKENGLINLNNKNWLNGFEKINIE
jgi:hypothetical protein